MAEPEGDWAKIEAERQKKIQEQKEFREKILAEMDSQLGDWLDQCEHPFMQAARDAPDSQVALNVMFERIDAEYKNWVMCIPLTPTVDMLSLQFTFVLSMDYHLQQVRHQKSLYSLRNRPETMTPIVK